VLPNVHWLYEHGDPRRLALVEAIPLPDGATAERLQALLDALLAGHEVLRSRLDRATMTLQPGDRGRIPLTEVQTAVDVAAAVGEQTLIALDELDPETGPLLRVLWLHPPGEPGVLLLVAHVLALDPASWRILLGEVDAGWHALADGLTPTIAKEHTSYRGVSDRLVRRAAELDTVTFWSAQLDGDDPDLGARRIRPGVDRAGDVAVTLSAASTSVTAGLLRAEVPVQHLLTMAAARMVAAWRSRLGQPDVVPLLALETHGRPDAIDDTTDTTDTVGLFSAIYPLRVRPDHPLPEIPGSGIDFGLLRYLRTDTSERLKRYRDPQLLLNYLGRMDIDAGMGLRPDRCLLEHVPLVPEPNAAARHELTLTVAVLPSPDGPVLATQWRTLPGILGDAEVAALTTIWQDQLAVVAGVTR
jgi:mycobactin peptide synthetase MbtF